MDEEVVAADFSGLVESGLLVPGSSLKLLGLESNAPLIEVGGQALFRGSYADTLGSLLLFRREEEQLQPPEATAGTADGGPVLINKFGFVCKASKTLKMERVFLQPKEPDAEEQPPAEAPP